MNDHGVNAEYFAAKFGLPLVGDTVLWGGAERQVRKVYLFTQWVYFKDGSSAKWNPNTMKKVNGPTMKDALSAHTTKISKAVNTLKTWHLLHYTGHFIDAHPEMKERIDAANKETEEVLKSFGYELPNERTIT